MPSIQKPISNPLQTSNLIQWRIMYKLQYKQRLKMGRKNKNKIRVWNSRRWVDWRRNGRHFALSSSLCSRCCAPLIFLLSILLCFACQNRGIKWAGPVRVKTDLSQTHMAQCYVNIFCSKISPRITPFVGELFEWFAYLMRIIGNLYS